MIIPEYIIVMTCILIAVVSYNEVKHKINQQKE